MDAQQPKKVNTGLMWGNCRLRSLWRDKTFFANTMSIDELPEDYEYMGDLTDEEANDTGLAGCKYYANKYISSFDEFYVYQECGTPIGENAAENTQRQWSYVKWVREGFERN